jgi:hypothetical protein
MQDAQRNADPEPRYVPAPVSLRADPTSVRALQRAAGNRAVSRALLAATSRVLARCGGRCTCGGHCQEEVEAEELLDRRVLARAVTEAPTPLLRIGSTGTAVSDLQSKINITGIQPQLGVDGIFGQRTKAAVEFFQESHRLAVDGIAGRETQAMLDRESALHGEAERASGALGPCHTPEAPGPDDQSMEPRQSEPVAGGLSLNFAVTDGDPDGGGGGGTRQPAPAVDLVVQLTSDDVSDALGVAHGGGAAPVKIKSVSALRDLIAKHQNVGRLTIISHALTNGEILFEGTSISTITLSDLAAKLRGAGTVREIVFLGCTVGNDATGLDDMKNALNSVSAEGSTGHHVATKIDAPTISGAPIDSEAKFQALTAEQKLLYLKALRQRARENHGDCITGFKPGQKLTSVSDDDLRAIAMKNKGVLTTEFCQESNGCWQDQKFEKSGPCRRVQAR